MRSGDYGGKISSILNASRGKKYIYFTIWNLRISKKKFATTVDNKFFLVCIIVFEIEFTIQINWSRTFEIFLQRHEE